MGEYYGDHQGGWGMVRGGDNRRVGHQGTASLQYGARRKEVEGVFMVTHYRREKAASLPFIRTHKVRKPSAQFGRDKNSLRL